MGRVGWGYLLGGIVELFGLTTLASDWDRYLFLCDDGDDLYDDLQQPPTRDLFNSTFFQSTKTQRNVSTDSVQMRIIDFFFPFFFSRTTHAQIYDLSFHLIPNLCLSFTPFGGPYYRLSPFEALYYR